MRIGFYGSVLQEAIRHIRCLGPHDFELIFGRGMWDHLWDKFKRECEGDVGKFICKLDNSNLDALMEHLEKHLVKHGVGI